MKRRQKSSRGQKVVGSRKFLDEVAATTFMLRQLRKVNEVNIALSTLEDELTLRQLAEPRDTDELLFDVLALQPEFKKGRLHRLLDEVRRR